MTRAEAFQILNKYVTDKNLIKHSLAAEAAMKALYKRLTAQDKHNKTDEEKWGITGLLHDADYELTKGHPEKHGLLLFEKEPNKIPADIAYAIKAHNYHSTKVQPQSPMDWTIATCDQLTGFIAACALVQPDKRIYMVTPQFVMGKLKEKSFAKGADRSSILLCEKKLGLPLQEFTTITLKAMQKIGNELGL
jgi:predicted hydrolase (HD superfamily)